MALNKYDKQHLRNLTAYERQVDAIYRAAVKEAAALGLSIRDLDTTRLFSFSDYPVILFSSKIFKKNIWEFQMSLSDDLKFPNMILNK